MCFWMKYEVLWGSGPPWGPGLEKEGPTEALKAKKLVHFRRLFWHLSYVFAGNSLTQVAKENDLSIERVRQIRDSELKRLSIFLNS